MLKGWIDGPGMKCVQCLYHATGRAVSHQYVAGPHPYSFRHCSPKVPFGKDWRGQKLLGRCVSCALVRIVCGASGVSLYAIARQDVRWPFSWDGVSGERHPQAVQTSHAFPVPQHGVNGRKIDTPTTLPALRAMCSINLYSSRTVRRKWRGVADYNRDVFAPSGSGMYR
jgi:hypothetical protein